MSLTVPIIGGAPWGGRRSVKLIGLKPPRNQICVIGVGVGLNWGGEAVPVFLSICQAFFQKICQRRKGN